MYENEHVQNVIKNLFVISNDNSFGHFILNKLKVILFMCMDVFVIGMRYYPLMGVMDGDGNNERRNSFVCMLLASMYMWADIVYNVLLTGVCEGKNYLLFFYTKKRCIFRITTRSLVYCILNGTKCKPYKMRFLCCWN
jgi:hypothetical protein